MTTKFLFVLTLLDLFINNTFGQAPPPMQGPPPVPVPVEVFAGNEYINTQLIVSKRFSPLSRFGFFSVTSFSAAYKDREHPEKREFFSTALVNYELVKGFSVTAGLAMNLYLGFRPTAGLQYVYGTPNLLLVLLPRIDLTQDNNFETFGLLQYTSRLTDQLRLYSRAQILYNQNTKLDFHERSYLNLRAGLGYGSFQFGLGVNFDQYGPLPVKSTNAGLFIRAELAN